VAKWGEHDRSARREDAPIPGLLGCRRPIVRVAGIEEFGDRVTVLEVPDRRAPRTGEVLIEVKAAGVGNWDEFAAAAEGSEPVDCTHIDRRHDATW
jgi:hypothetical protein